MVKFREYAAVYLLGAAGYCLLEILWRGYTHWTMAITGGVCFTLVYVINILINDSALWVRCFWGAAAITGVEMAAGSVVNLALGMNVWDYSDMPFNFFGQICLPYSALWFILCVPLFLLCGFLRKKFTAIKNENRGG